MANFAHDTVVPEASSAKEKREQVADMFDDIAHRYDFLNRFLSGGTDIAWRRKALNKLAEIQPQHLLDMATGTGDVAIMAAQMLKPKKITGMDISEGMMAIGRKKVEAAGLSHIISLEKGDSEAIKMDDNTLDAITVAFGVRNFQHLDKGLSEFFRVLRPGGKVVVLEFSKPKNAFVKPFYSFYMRFIAPGIGGIFSKNKTAYSYLSNSIKKFPEGEAFLQELTNAGFKEVAQQKLTFGVCSIYTGKK